MSEELDVLKLVSQRLERVGIDYMITGSIAANYYTVPRMTRDIDIVIALKQSDVLTVLRLFQSDFYIDEQMIRDALVSQGMFNIIHNGTVIKIDFIIRKSSEYRQCEFKRRCRIDIDGEPLWVVSREDLILSKLDWAKESLSDLQLRDVRNLLQDGEQIDMPYLETWIHQLNLGFVYEKVRT